MRENTLCHTELARAQPMSIILKLFKLAVRVVQYQDRIKLHLPSACPVKRLLQCVSELLCLAPRHRCTTDAEHRFTTRNDLI